MNAGRRCALPGCYVVIEAPPDGGPQRKYCTAAHRAIARQQRREGTNRSASAPPLMPPELPLPPLQSWLEPAPPRRRGQYAGVTGRRTRVLAMLGSAGLLVTGGTMAFSDPSSGTADDTTATPLVAPDPDAEQNWTADVRVTLASLDRQLEEVSAAEQEWNSLAPEERGEEAPEGVRALSRRKALLQQQRTALAGELASVQSLNDAKRDLAETERHVADIDRKLAATPKDSPAEADRVRTLRELRAAREKQREAQRQDLDGLHESVRDAMATPLPGGDHATRSITSAVRELVRNPALRQPRRPVGPPPGATDPGSFSPDPGAGLLPDRTGREPGPAQRHGRPDILAAPPSVEGGSLDTLGKAPVLRRAPVLGEAPIVGGQAPGAKPGPGVASGAPVRRPAARGGLLDSVTRPGQGVGEHGRGIDPGIDLGGINGGITGRPRGGSPASEPTDSAVTTGRGDGRGRGNRVGSVDSGLDKVVGPVELGSERRAGRPAPVRPASKPAPRESSVDLSRLGGARTEYRAADAAISAMPLSAGVKQIARSAVSDQLERRQQDSGGSSFAYRSDGGSATRTTSSDAARRAARTRYSTSADSVERFAETWSSAYSSSAAKRAAPKSGSSGSSRTTKSRSSSSSSGDALRSIVSRYASKYASNASAKGRDRYRSSSDSKSSSSTRYKSSSSKSSSSKSSKSSSSKSSGSRSSSRQKAARSAARHVVKRLFGD